MNDNPSARATHERGIKHQENLSRRESIPQELSSNTFILRRDAR